MRRRRPATRWATYGLGLVLGLALAGPVPVARTAPAPAERVAEHAARAGAIKIKPKSATVGRPVTARGRVAYGPRKVRVQVRRVGGPWKKVASTRSRKSGRFKVAFVAPSRAGKHQVRAVAPRAKVRGKRRGAVKTRAVRLGVRPSAAALTLLPQDGAVVALVNAERAKAGCGPVTHHPRLHVAARGHSEDMARSGVLSHIGTDGSTYDERATAAGYRWSLVGENVADGYPTAAQVMAAWMGSKIHRDNILHCGFVHVGVGLASARSGRPYWTQLFGRPG